MNILLWGFQVMVAAGPDPAGRRRAHAGNLGPRQRLRAVFAQNRRHQPVGLGRRDGAARGLRGARAIRAQAAGLTHRSRARTSQPG
jgi:hypothetical protein